MVLWTLSMYVYDLFTWIQLAKLKLIVLIMVFDAILTSRQPRAKLQYLHDDLKSNDFRRTAVLKKKMYCKASLYWKSWGRFICSYKNTFYTFFCKIFSSWRLKFPGKNCRQIYGKSKASFCRNLSTITAPKFVSKILRFGDLLYKTCMFSEQQFYGNYSK